MTTEILKKANELADKIANTQSHINRFQLMTPEEEMIVGSRVTPALIFCPNEKLCKKIRKIILDDLQADLAIMEAEFAELGTEGETGE